MFSSGAADIALLNLNPVGGKIWPFQGSTASLSSPSSASACSNIPTPSGSSGTNASAWWVSFCYYASCSSPSSKS